MVDNITETKVELLADGDPVFKAMDVIGAKVAKIQVEIQKILTSADKGVAGLDAKLERQIKTLQTSMSQLSTMSKFLESGGQGKGPITSINRDTALAKATLAATAAAKTLGNAENAADRLQAHLNVAMKSAAEIGAKGGLVSRQDEQRISSLKSQILELKRIDNLEAQLEARALRMNKASAEVAAVRGARANLANSLAAPGKNSFDAEFAQLKTAQAELKGRLAAGNGPSILPAGGLGTVLARTAAYAAAGSGIFAIVGALQQGISFAVEFDDALGKLQAIAGATDGQMSGLSESILAVGKTSRFSLKELAEASTLLAQAGFSSKDIQTSLQSVSTLAAASGSTVAQSVDVITSTIAAFNLQTTDAVRISDSFTAALNRTKLTMGDIQAAIGTVGATAAESNMSPEELISAIGAMAQAGVRGTRAATGLRQLLIDMMDPSKKLSEELRTLGITFEDIDVKTQGLPSVLENLKMKGFGATEAFKGLENRSAAAFLVLERQVPLMRSTALAMTETGVAAAAAAKATNTFQSQWNILKNTLGEAVINSSVVDSLKTFLRLINEISVGAQGQNKFIKSLGESTKDLVSLALDPQLVILSDLLSAWAKLHPAVTTYASKLDKAATVSKNASDEFDNQQKKVSSLNEAISHMVARQGELKDKSAALGAQTMSMSQQFQGLAGYLDITKSSFENLFQAAEKYRGSQLKILENQAGVMASGYAAQAQVSRTQGIDVFGQLRKAYPNGLDRKTSTDVNAAKEALRIGGHASPEAIAALTTDANTTKDPKLAQILRDLVTAIQGTIGAVGLQQGAGVLGDSARILQNGGVPALQAQIDRLTNKPGDKVSVEGLIRILEARLKLNPENQGRQTAIAGLLDQLYSKRGSPGGLAEEKAQRDRGHTMTGAAVASLLKGEYSDANPYSFGKRSLAEQQSLYAAYKNGTGALAAKPGTSNHGKGQALDMKPLDGVSLEEVVNFLESKGLFVTEALNEKNPKTGGTHWHIGWGTKASSLARRQESERKKALGEDISNEKMGVGTAERELNREIKDTGEQTTFATYEAQAKTARTALKNWATLYRTQGKLEASKMLPNQGKQHLIEVEARIKQTTEESLDKIGDSLQKVIEGMLKAAQTAFDLAIAPAEAAAGKAEAILAGLNSPLLSGKVPDYIKTLAQQRIDKAHATVDQDRLASYGPQVAEAQSGVSMKQAAVNAIPFGDSSYDKAKTELDALKKKLLDLIKARDDLQAKMGVEGIIPSTLGGGFRQAIDAIKGASDFGLSFKTMMITDVGGAIDSVRSGLQGFFGDIFSGSVSAGQAFGNMAKGIMKYMEELLAKAIATQLFNFLIGLVSPGSKSVFSPSQGGAGTASFGINPSYAINGGPIGFAGGGEVMNGSAARDSVFAVLGRGEFVVNRSSVDAVGPKFMAKLNNQGARALSDLKSGPSMVNVLPRQDMKVFVVAPTARPGMSPQDVILTISDDMLKGGVTQSLVRHISQGG
jgi:TP901 family phage tail tape measure protein